jgi:tripartite-type tricarboxylate transporter receptor subunit TctC
MKLPRRRFLGLAGAAVALPAVSHIARAQAYPTRPVRVIVPYGPAGIADVVARFVAEKLTDRLGKQFYIENVPGAGGNIGTGRAAHAAPDGYTILIVTPNFVTNPALYDKIPYDPRKDFDSITLAATNTVALALHPSVPARTVNEFVAFVRANPGKYGYASAGTGTTAHLVGQLFRLSLQLDLAHIPFNSLGLAVGSVIAGHTPIIFGGLPPIVPQAREGKLRVLAVTSKTRAPALPDVPTMAAAGYPDIEGENWQAFLVPAGTPREIVTLLHREIVAIIALPDVKERLATLGLEPVGTTPEECAAQMRTEIVKWAKVIREAGIRAE